MIFLNVLISVNRYRIIRGAPGQRMTMRAIYTVFVFVVLLSIVFGITVGVISSADIAADGNLICKISESTRLVFYIVHIRYSFCLSCCNLCRLLTVKMIRNVKRRQRRVFPMQPTENREEQTNTVSSQFRLNKNVYQNQVLAAGTSQGQAIRPQQFLSASSSQHTDSQEPTLVDFNNHHCP